MSHCLPCRIAYSSFEVLTQSWKCWSALCGPRLTCKVINLQNSASISSWYWADLWPCLSSLCATRYRTPQSAQVITCSATPTRSGNRDQATSCIKRHSNFKRHSKCIQMNAEIFAALWIILGRCYDTGAIRSCTLWSACTCSASSVCCLLMYFISVNQRVQGIVNVWSPMFK